MNAVCKADEKRGILVKEVSTNIKVLFKKLFCIFIYLHRNWVLMFLKQ